MMTSGEHIICSLNDPEILQAYHTLRKEKEKAGWGQHAENYAAWSVLYHQFVTAVNSGNWSRAREMQTLGDSLLQPGAPMIPVWEMFSMHVRIYLDGFFKGQKHVCIYGTSKADRDDARKSPARQVACKPDEYGLDETPEYKRFKESLDHFLEYIQQQLSNTDHWSTSM